MTRFEVQHFLGELREETVHGLRVLLGGQRLLGDALLGLAEVDPVFRDHRALGLF